MANWRGSSAAQSAPVKTPSGELKLLTENLYYLALAAGVFAVFAVTLAYYSSNAGK